jgi:hypothetical protein
MNGDNDGDDNGRRAVVMRNKQFTAATLTRFTIAGRMSKNQIVKFLEHCD